MPGGVFQQYRAHHSRQYAGRQGRRHPLPVDLGKQRAASALGKLVVLIAKQNVESSLLFCSAPGGIEMLPYRGFMPQKEIVSIQGKGGAQQTYRTRQGSK